MRRRCSSRRELRALAQPPEHSPSITDQLYRSVSIYVSVPLARAGATPNAITIWWIVIGLAGVVGLAAETWPIRVTGALLLQLSYLLDYVDGEVARLTDRRSMTGGFLDLIGHGVIKVSLPLGVGWAAARMSGRPAFLLAAAAGAVAIGVGDSLRFYAACTSGDLGAGDLGHTVQVRSPGISVMKVVRGVASLSFETPGLYGFAALAAVTNGFAILSLLWALAGPAWMIQRARAYCRRLSAPTSLPASRCR